MKKYLLLSILLLAAPAFGAWTTVYQPVVDFDDTGNPVAVLVCAEDNLAGTVCASVTQDAAGRPLALNGGNDLANKTSVRQALRTAMNAARAETLAAISKQSQDRTRRQSISLPVTPGDL